MNDLLTPLERDTPFSSTKGVRLRQMRAAIRTQMRLPKGAVCVCGELATEMHHGEPSFRWLAAEFMRRHPRAGTLGWRLYHEQTANPRPVCGGCHAVETRAERRVRAKGSRRKLAALIMQQRGCSRQEAYAWLDKRVRT